MDSGYTKEDAQEIVDRLYGLGYLEGWAADWSAFDAEALEWLLRECDSGEFQGFIDHRDIVWIQWLIEKKSGVKIELNGFYKVVD